MKQIYTQTQSRNSSSSNNKLQPENSETIWSKVYDIDGTWHNERESVPFKALIYLFHFFIFILHIHICRCRWCSICCCNFFFMYRYAAVAENFLAIWAFVVVYFLSKMSNKKFLTLFIPWQDLSSCTIFLELFSSMQSNASAINFQFEIQHLRCCVAYMY